MRRGHNVGVAIIVKKVSSLEYKYNAWKPGTEESIIHQTLNSSGVRDINDTTTRMVQSDLQAQKQTRRHSCAVVGNVADD
ncbi:MAG: hypothetical protein LBC89_05190 [Bacteroidales bacterium]|nr:hypothetical protein [Bacteroidales bacterium]